MGKKKVMERVPSTVKDRGSKKMHRAKRKGDEGGFNPGGITNKRTKATKKNFGLIGGKNWGSFFVFQQN